MARPSIIPIDRQEEFKTDVLNGMGREGLLDKYGLKNFAQINYFKRAWGVAKAITTASVEGVVSNGELSIPSLAKSYARDCERVDANVKREKEKFKQEYLKIQETELVIKNMRRKLH